MAGTLPRSTGREPHAALSHSPNSCDVGGTDGFFFRELGIDVYGVNHFERDEDKRAHGRDERIGIRQFEEAARVGCVLARTIGQ